MISAADPDPDNALPCTDISPNIFRRIRHWYGQAIQMRDLAEKDKSKNLTTGQRTDYLLKIMSDLIPSDLEDTLYALAADAAPGLADQMAHYGTKWMSHEDAIFRAYLEPVSLSLVTKILATNPIARHRYASHQDSIATPLKFAIADHSLDDHTLGDTVKTRGKGLYQATWYPLIHNLRDSIYPYLPTAHASPHEHAIDAFATGAAEYLMEVLLPFDSFQAWNQSSQYNHLKRYFLAADLNIEQELCVIRKQVDTAHVSALINPLVWELSLALGRTIAHSIPEIISDSISDCTRIDREKYRSAALAYQIYAVARQVRLPPAYPGHQQTRLTHKP
jgi:hypothetical protein